MFIAIRSDPSGAVMYVDGKAAAAHPGLALRLPTDHEEGRLVLGNNIYGSSGWRGQILGFALHLDALSEGALRNHFEAWRRGDGFAGDGYRSAQVAYPFSERQGRKALDRSANGLALNFPNETTGLAPQFFEPLTKGLRRGDVRDIIINIGGFIPFGFFLAALFGRATPVGRLTTVGVAMTIGFTLSFGIEFAQAWMPSRSSSLLDLLLNTAGSGLGGSAFALLLRRGPPGW